LSGWRFLAKQQVIGAIYNTRPLARPRTGRGERGCSGNHLCGRSSSAADGRRRSRSHSPQRRSLTSCSRSLIRTRYAVFTPGQGRHRRRPAALSPHRLVESRGRAAPQPASPSHAQGPTRRELADQPHRLGPSLIAVPIRRRLPRTSLWWHHSILACKVWSFHRTQEVQALRAEPSSSWIALSTDRCVAFRPSRSTVTKSGA
jgi:hypothetical protein